MAISSPGKQSRAGRGELNSRVSVAVEHPSYRPVLEEIRQTIPCGEMIVLTSLPRGTLQFVQPARVREQLLKTYMRDVHAHDRLSWQAMCEHRVVTDAELWPRGPSADNEDRFFTHYLSPAGLRHVAVAPLNGPVLDGYPGVIHLYRSASQGPFTDHEIERLSLLAQRADSAAQAARAARRDGSCRQNQSPWNLRPPRRHFIIDSELRAYPTSAGLDTLGTHLRQQILELARQRLHHLNGQAVTADRVNLLDEVGGYWPFRVITHREYPAIGSGPFIFFCVLPDCCDWSLLHSADFHADPEMARLIPAMRYMRQEFHRSPTLKEISRQVHLSPFHFHRRFTELLGITPKHFMLDCQIFQAKRELMERNKDLSRIATDCGFAHQSHFTSRFKQTTGLTPTRWRRAYSAAAE